MNTSESDILWFQHAIRLAIEAEKEGNLPIGAVISLDGRIIAEGKKWIGPAYAEECDKLFDRVMILVEKMRGLGI
jgi:hypothetical protein